MSSSFYSPLPATKCEKYKTYLKLSFVHSFLIPHYTASLLLENFFRFNMRNTGVRPSHLLTFSPSHLLTFSPSHLLTFSPSHLLTFSPSHLLTFSPSHLRTFAPSHLLTFAPSHLRTFSPSHFKTKTRASSGRFANRKSI